MQTMKTIALLIFVLLAQLLLAAHFLRAGNGPLLALALGFALLLLHRRAWVARLMQAWLLVGSAVWIGTLYRLWNQRTAAGAPAGRMAAILGVVAGLTALAALLFETGRLRRLYRRSGGSEPT